MIAVICARKVRIGEIFCVVKQTHTAIRYVCWWCSGGDGDDDNDDAFIADTTVIELDFESVHPIYMTSSSTLPFR